jgi:hypothetical protein
MKQKLLVEGDNDIHVISNLAIVKKIPPFLGIKSKEEFENKVVEIAQSISKIKPLLKTVLADEDLKTVGVIIDADDKPTQSAWDSLKVVLVDFGYKNIPNKLNDEGIILIEEGMPKFGLWVMPDNVSEGYLEHFYEHLIHPNDEFLQLAKQITEGFITENKNRFSKIAKQKADINTWLAWQKNPELPMGLAIRANKDLLNLEHPIVEKFINWLRNLFEFEQL